MSQHKTNQVKSLVDYNEELHKLIAIPNVSIEHNIKISNTQYEKVLRPLYNWLSKLLILNKLNFTITIFQIGRRIIVYFEAQDRLNSPIFIPKQISNLEIGTIFDIDKIIVENGKSLIISEITTPQILCIIACNNMKPDIDICRQIEKVELQLLKKMELLIRDLESSSNLIKIEEIKAIEKQLELYNFKEVITTHEALLNTLAFNNFEYNSKVQMLTGILSTATTYDRRTIQNLNQIIYYLKSICELYLNYK